MRISFKKLKIIIALLAVVSIQQVLANTNVTEKEFALKADGTIPTWLVCGPFELPLVGFGSLGDVDAVGEKSIEPFEGKVENNALTLSEKSIWQIQSINDNGFLDFNNSLAVKNPGNHPEKIREAKTGYAATYLYSEKEAEVVLLTGSNSRQKIFLNGRLILHIQKERGAQKDQDSIPLKLKKGKNLLLIKVDNSNLNYSIPFWGGIPWGWGFYARLQNPANEIYCKIPIQEKVSTLDANSTFFFKQNQNELQQRINLEIDWRSDQVDNVKLVVKTKNQKHEFELGKLNFGLNRKAIYLHEIKADTEWHFKILAGTDELEKNIILIPQQKYELHLMLTAHMDIGYTHPQPLGAERHLQTLDQVLKKCEQDPEFNWTIEALILLEEYEKNRPAKQFEKLMKLIQQGRIAVSPLYANPFTGWIDEGELIASFTKAKNYTKQFNIKYPGALYNDTPGLNWALPQALNKAGTRFIGCGINEIYGGYKIQQSFPKAFKWQGASGSSVFANLSQTYLEGRVWGLEGGIESAESRIRNQIFKLQAKGYQYPLVLLDAAFTDNAGIPMEQYETAKKWNREFAYPKIVISNLAKFANAFEKAATSNVQVLKGDWTSDWDVLTQGEFQRMIEYRNVQNRLLQAGKLAAISWFEEPSLGSLGNKVDAAYESLLKYSGHGSGLEFGYGSPEANKLTFDYREGYVQKANLLAEEIVLRASGRLAEAQVAVVKEGVIVFNTLSWQRDIPMEILFPEQNLKNYSVYDPNNKKEIPSYRDGHKLYFVARDVPPLGYTKFILRQNSTDPVQDASDLIISDNSIENTYYKITFKNNKITGIEDKLTKKQLLNINSDFSLNQLICAKSGSDNFENIKMQKGKLSIIDQRPQRIILEIEYENPLLKSVQITLQENLNRLDFKYVVDLESLAPPEVVEEYGVAFPFNLKNSTAEVEILGGFLNPEKDRIHPSEHNAFSMRNTVLLATNDFQVFWNSKQARVIRLFHNLKQPVVVANLVNNFPENWNRREENKGLLEYDFSVTTKEGSKDYASAAQSGKSFANREIWYYSLYDETQLIKNYINIENQNIQLVMVKPDEQPGVIELYLQNVHPIMDYETTIESEFFQKSRVFEVDYLNQNKKEIPVNGQSIQLSFGKNEQKKIQIEILK